MECPRCKLSLRPTDYEGVEVDICDSCWGIWLDKGELLAVINTREMNFSAEERRQLTELRGAPPLEAGADPVAHCPRCDRAMDQIHSDAAVHILIDRCPDHGVWLDAGEIKTVQAVAEKSAALHRLLIEKLGLRGH